MDDDIPSDFFDDFTKDDFIDGLSVVDSWKDKDSAKREVLDKVDDLRELISKETKQSPTQRSQHSKSRDPLDDYIKPGSRRDPNKTNLAIKKDKEVKVKEILAKQLQSSDELRPPGTELDDFYNDVKATEKSKERKRVAEEFEIKPRSRSREKEYKFVHRNNQYGGNLRRSPRRFDRRSPRRFMNRSPAQQHLPFRRSPIRSRRYSPSRRSPRRSPRRPLRRSRSTDRRRSPIRRRSKTRRSRSPPNLTDSFLYPHEYKYQNPLYASGISGPELSEYPSGSGYVQPPVPAYNPGYPGPYSQPMQQAPPMIPPTGVIPPAPVPMPVPAPVPAPALNSVPSAITGPPSVYPSQPTSISSTFHSPYDALAQLVADGKLSQEDYMKLAPNKGSANIMDFTTKLSVLNRCHDALSKLDKFTLPNRLVMINNIVGPSEMKSITPKFCSPLKRQAVIEFQYTKANSGGTAQQNKQLIDSIIETIGLNKMIAQPKKKHSKTMKDAAVQTTKPYCDVCEVRESTKFYDADTSTEHEYLTSTVHTQVVEQELMSSKTIFNPSGSMADSGPISIAHLTPAQLVSQLAARAKTLKQNYDEPPSSNNYDRRMNYDTRGSGSQQYQNQNYKNYRY